MTVSAFGSFEEMQAHMKAAEDRANAMVTPEQLAIKPGDYIEQAVNPAQYGDLRVMGTTFTEDQFVEREEFYARQDPDEWAMWDEGWERRRFRERVERGYIHGWWSSNWEAGEYGDCHRYNMLRSVSKEEYDAFMAEVHGKPVPALVQYPPEPGV